MKRLLGMAALAGVGVLAYRAMKQRQEEQGQGLQTPSNQAIRDAGPDAMRDQPARWTSVDERSDESFPASDSPGTY